MQPLVIPLCTEKFFTIDIFCKKGKIMKQLDDYLIHLKKYAQLENQPR